MTAYNYNCWISLWEDVLAKAATIIKTNGIICKVALPVVFSVNQLYRAKIELDLIECLEVFHILSHHPISHIAFNLIDSFSSTYN